MKKLIRKIGSIALAGALIFGGSANISVSQNLGTCMNNRAIAVAAASGVILPLVQLLRRAGIGANANVLNVRVCQIQGQPYYLIDVLHPNGAAQNLILRANDGTPYVAG